MPRESSTAALAQLFSRRFCELRTSYCFSIVRHQTNTKENDMPLTGPNMPYPHLPFGTLGIFPSYPTLVTPLSDVIFNL